MPCKSPAAHIKISRSLRGQTMLLHHSLPRHHRCSGMSMQRRRVRSQWSTALRHPRQHPLLA